MPTRPGPIPRPCVARAFGRLHEADLRKVAAGNAAVLFRHPLPPADDWRGPAATP